MQMFSSDWCPLILLNEDTAGNNCRLKAIDRAFHKPTHSKSKVQEEVSINSCLKCKLNLWVIAQLCGGWSQCIKMALVSFCSFVALLAQ